MPNKQYYKENREKVLLSNRNWILNNKDKYKKYRRKYYKENKQRLINYSKEWKNKNIRRHKDWINTRFNKTPWMKNYFSIKRRVLYHPNYAGRGIKNFLTPKDLKYLWIRDSAKNMEKPSIDRIDGRKNYTLNNCRFIELIENIRRPRIWKKGKISKV